METPQPLPSLNLPSSGEVVQVFAIDNGARINLRTNFLLLPDVGGQEYIHFPSYVFLVQHPSGRKVLFDLGIRKDWESAAPSVMRQIMGSKSEITSPENIIDVLKRHGIQGQEIEAVIWSHFHFDHTGDVSTFPSSTSLVVGPDFKAKMTPGYPSNPEAPVLESDYANRELREITFDQQLKIGRFKAYDYFGDDSFYLLDTPGHSIAHMCALARTNKDGSGDDTFVFMGGDCAHHCAEFRPTTYLPLPAEVTCSDIGLEGKAMLQGQRFVDLHPEHSAVKPFYYCNPRTAYNFEEAEWSLEGMEEFDAHPNILTMAAHDDTLLTPMKDLFLPRPLNGWREARIRENVLWRFLGEFPEIQADVAKA